MPQQIYQVCKDETNVDVFLNDLADVTIEDPAEKHMLVYDPEAKIWNNSLVADVVGKIGCGADIVSGQFNAECCSSYIVNVNSVPATAQLPDTPIMGCTIFFIDKKAINNNELECRLGFGNNQLTIKPGEGQTIENADDETGFLFLDYDRAFVELMYIGCDTWRILKSNKDIGPQLGEVMVYVNNNFISQTSAIDFIEGENTEITGAQAFFSLTGDRKVEVTVKSLSVDELADLKDINFDSDELEGDRYMKFNPVSKQWDAPLIDFVVSVNNFTGEVILTTDDVPDTFQNKYLNRARFETECTLTDLDLFQDVEYDTALRDGYALTMIDGKWRPRRPFGEFTLPQLKDVAFEYNQSFYQTYGFVDDWGRSTNFVRMLSLRISSPHTQTNDVSSIQAGDWKPHYLREILAGERLGVLLDVDVPENPPRLYDVSDPRYEPVPSHGRSLMYNAYTGNWELGGYLDLETSDNLQMGIVNLYCRTDTLPRVAEECLDLHHLLGVNVPNHNNAPIYAETRVLGYDPNENEWTGMLALTENATTANIPEPWELPVGTPRHIWTPFDSLDPMHRVYFTTQRLHHYNTYTLKLTHISDVQTTKYQDPVNHGQSLVFDTTTNEWVAGYPTSAINTDYLPEGSQNLYYTDERVRLWTDANIRDVGINYFANVATQPSIEDGQSLVYVNGTWTSGWPIPLPIQDTGDLLVGGNNPPYNYRVLPVSSKGRYLRVDPGAELGIAWQDPDQLYKQELALPDIPNLPFTRPQDQSGILHYIGTDFGNESEYVNPLVPRDYINIYLNGLTGSPLFVLADKTFFNINYSDENPFEVMDINASFITIDDEYLVADFQSPAAVRITDIVLQAEPFGDNDYRIEISKDGATWEDLGLFELSLDMKQTTRANGRHGKTTKIDTDVTLNNRLFWRISTGLGVFTGTEPDENFFRYLRIKRELYVESRTLDIYEIEFYGYYNTDIKYHYLRAEEVDHYLVSGFNKMEFILPMNLTDLEAFEPGYQVYIVCNNYHEITLFTEVGGYVMCNVTTDQEILRDNAITLYPGDIAHVVYHGIRFHRPSNTNYPLWSISVATSPGSGGTPGTNVPYHTHEPEDINNLSDVALSGSYSDLTNLPTFATVATTGEYSNLLNLPTLGTAAAYDVGTSPGQLVELVEVSFGVYGLPAIDGSLLTGISVEVEPTLPIDTKGDLITHNGLDPVSIGVGTDGQVLVADSTEISGLKWANLSIDSALVQFLAIDAADTSGQRGEYYLDLSNATGLLPATQISGLTTLLHPLAFSGSALDLEDFNLGTAAGYDVGTAVNNVVQLNDVGGVVGLPAIDGSRLLNVGTTALQLKGDMLVKSTSGVSKVEIPRDINNNNDNTNLLPDYVLVSDDDVNNPIGVKWIPASFIAGEGSQGSTASFLRVVSSDIEGEQGFYFLDRANHFGFVDYTDITGFNYENLNNLPVLGTAAFEDYLNPDNPTQSPGNKLLMLDAAGRIPAVDGSLIRNIGLGALPLTTKGALITYNGSVAVELPPGVTGQILTANNTAFGGLEWVDYDNDATTLGGELPSYYLNLANVTGQMDSSFISDLGTSATLDVGTSGNNVVQLLPDGSLPAVDASNLLNLPTGLDILIGKGQIATHNGTNIDVLEVGSNGQILSADSTATEGLRWIDAPTGGSGGLSTNFYDDDFTAVINTISLVDTTVNGPVTATLPDTPANGSKVVFSDFASNFDINNLIVNPSGTNTIHGQSSLSLTTKYSTVSLVFWADRWVMFGTNSFSEQI